MFDYSQDKNIEVGVKTEHSPLNNLASKLISSENNVDRDAWEYFNKVIENSELVFQNIPQYDSALFGLTKKYTGYKTTFDKISEHFSKNNTSKKSNASTSESEIGYCIRTGQKIAFNLSMPFCEKAFEIWSQYKNPNYKEKFCHKTGKPSNGKTSKANPIL